MGVAVHLVAASSVHGGPERLLLGLLGALPEPSRAAVLSFGEGGHARPVLDAAAGLGVEAVELRENAPRYRAAIAEIAGHLRRLDASALCAHGYKPDILGLAAARRAGVPAVAVSHGWTAASWKVRLNERLDRMALRRMDRVVCVSDGQAAKVRRAGVRADRVVVIRNAVNADRFTNPDPADRARLLDLFPGAPPRRIVGAVGRLSPEKGIGVLIDAAAEVLATRPDVGFAVAGDGPLRAALARAVEAAGLSQRFILAGFRDDVDRLVPHLDLMVLPSFTEGLPTVALEASAAGVAIVATAVGGTPEAVVDGETGLLVPPGDPPALAARIGELLDDEPRRLAMGRRGRDFVRERFTFPAMARSYQDLFDGLAGRRTRPAAGGPSPV